MILERTQTVDLSQVSPALDRRMADLPPGAKRRVDAMMANVSDMMGAAGVASIAQLHDRLVTGAMEPGVYKDCVRLLARLTRMAQTGQADIDWERVDYGRVVRVPWTIHSFAGIFPDGKLVLNTMPGSIQIINVEDQQIEYQLAHLEEKRLALGITGDGRVVVDIPKDSTHRICIWNPETDSLPTLLPEETGNVRYYAHAESVLVDSSATKTATIVNVMTAAPEDVSWVYKNWLYIYDLLPGNRLLCGLGQLVVVDRATHNVIARYDGDVSVVDYVQSLADGTILIQSDSEVYVWDPVSGTSDVIASGIAFRTKVRSLDAAVNPTNPDQIMFLDDPPNGFSSLLVFERSTHKKIRGLTSLRRPVHLLVGPDGTIYMSEKMDIVIYDREGDLV